MSAISEAGQEFRPLFGHAPRVELERLLQTLLDEVAPRDHMLLMTPTGGGHN